MKTLKSICDENRETTDRATQLTPEGVRQVIEFLGIHTIDEYMGQYAADILLSIDAIDDKRPSINKRAAKEVLA